MARIELTLSPDYVSTWGISEALRELEQNIIDRANEDYYAKKIHIFEPENERLIVGNQNTTIPKKTLLLGQTTKRNDSNSIGTFGEGYKLALLILNRLGLKTKIYNGSELWEPKIIESRKFGGKLLVIDTSLPNYVDTPKDLIFYIEGVTKEMYADFKNKCLFHQEVGSVIDVAGTGQILLNPKFGGKLFVEGLFICDSKTKYGYNFKSHKIQLNRDRSQVGDFDLSYESSRLWMHHNVTAEDELNKIDTLVVDMMKSDSLDIRFISSFGGSNFRRVCELKMKKFNADFNPNSVPVKTSEEAKHLREIYDNVDPIIVTSSDYEYYSCTPTYKERLKSLGADNMKLDSPQSILKTFKYKYQNNLGYNELQALDEIIGQAYYWSN